MELAEWPQRSTFPSKEPPAELSGYGPDICTIYLSVIIVSQYSHYNIVTQSFTSYCSSNII